ncbi:hypothetical protein [Halopiger goleimassiliensis]|uniref:hypothetical protein n=1 Tax=Halopiger goleimassiliensis TaxID=1293048 RepID=UPI000B0F2477|nr:hypothetical protein [Halopiger goleimassiliensis]
MLLSGIATVLVDAIPMRALFDPRFLVDSFVGALFLVRYGGVEALPWVGVPVLFLLYYVSIAVIAVSVVSIVRER